MTFDFGNLSSQDTSVLADSLQAMLKREQQPHFRKSCNYLNNDSGISSDERMEMVDWAYSIIDTCKFERTNVAMVCTKCILEHYISGSFFFSHTDNPASKIGDGYGRSVTHAAQRLGTKLCQ